MTFGKCIFGNPFLWSKNGLDTGHPNIRFLRFRSKRRPLQATDIFLIFAKRHRLTALSETGPISPEN